MNVEQSSKFFKLNPLIQSDQQLYSCTVVQLSLLHINKGSIPCIRIGQLANILN